METQGPILIFFFYQSVIPFRLSIFRDFVGLFWLIWAIWGSSGSQSPCWFHLMGGGVSLGMASQCLWLGWREEFFGVRTQTYFLTLAMPRCSSFPLSCPHVAGKNHTSQGDFLLSESPFLVLPGTCYPSLGQGSLRPGGSGECFPWPPTVRGDPDPVLVLSASAAG